MEHNDLIQRSEVSLLISSFFFSFSHYDFFVNIPVHFDLSLLLIRLIGGYFFGFFYLGREKSDQKHLWRSVMLHAMANLVVRLVT